MRFSMRHQRLFRPGGCYDFAEGGGRSFGNSLPHHQLLKAGIGHRIALNVGKMRVEIFLGTDTGIVRHGAGGVRCLRHKIRQRASSGLGEDVVRHSLRHTAATWQMQAGTDLWEAAGWLGMTVEQFEQNYGHHHPDFQEDAAEAFGGRR